MYEKCYKNAIVSIISCSGCVRLVLRMRNISGIESSIFINVHLIQAYQLNSKNESILSTNSLKKILIDNYTKYILLIIEHLQLTRMIGNDLPRLVICSI